MYFWALPLLFVIADDILVGAVDLSSCWRVEVVGCHCVAAVKVMG